MITAEIAPPSPESTKSAKITSIQILRVVLWVLLGTIFLIFFTLIKLPEDKIGGWVQGQISTMLASKDISFTAESSGLSIGLGLTYRMHKISLHLPAQTAPVLIDEIDVSPSFLGFIFGKIGGDMTITPGDGGSMWLSGSTKNTEASVAFRLKNFNIGKLGLLPLLANIKASAILSGTGEISGNYQVPASFAGDVDISFSKFVFDQQTIGGFFIPRLNVSEGKITAKAEKGRILISTSKIGKTAEDDIRATATGDVLLGKQWESSVPNLKLDFSFSETVLKSFVLIDAFLGPGRKPDGSYSFLLGGSFASPSFVPANK